MLPWIFFGISLTSAVICKQRFLHENEIVQYLQNSKYEGVNQGHFRKPLQASTSAMKNAMKNDSPYIFHGPFNFKLLFTFKL